MAELGVSWIIDGGVQRVGSQISVTARIVDVETGTTDRTFKVDGELDELFSFQDRIGRVIKTGLTTLAPFSIARRPSHWPSPYPIIQYYTVLYSIIIL